MKLIQVVCISALLAAVSAAAASKTRPTKVDYNWFPYALGTDSQGFAYKHYRLSGDSVGSQKAPFVQGCFWWCLQNSYLSNVKDEKKVCESFSYNTKTKMCYGFNNLAYVSSSDKKNVRVTWSQNPAYISGWVASAYDDISDYPAS